MKRTTPEYTTYEYQVMDQHRQTTSHKTWHWNHIPEQELYNAGYITNFNKHRLAKRLKKNNGQIGEFGLDGLAVDPTSNTYHGIQAKRYTIAKITADKLGTFLSVIHNRLKIKHHQSKGYLYYNGKLQIDLKEDLQNGNAILPIHFVPTSNTTETTHYKILQTFGRAVEKWSGPWALACDWQMAPFQRLESGWLQGLRGMLCAPRKGTCRTALGDWTLIDYFAMGNHWGAGIENVKRCITF